MQFAYSSQRLQDWLSQQWCILTGRRVDPADDAWLMGPFGNVGVIEDRYVDVLADQERLSVRRNESGFGLLDSIDVLNLPHDQRARLRPEIVAFYEHTLDYEFEVWSHWCQFFRPFGGMISRLYSRRLQQLNLPLNPLDTAFGIRSQIYKLIDDETGAVRHTIWYRHLKSNQTERVITGPGTSRVSTNPSGCSSIVKPCFVRIMC